MFYFFFVFYTQTTRETHDEMKGENKENSCIIVYLATNANSYMCHVHLCEVSSNEIWISVYTEKLVHTLSHEYHV